MGQNGCLISFHLSAAHMRRRASFALLETKAENKKVTQHKNI
jgi:hypothetical protein